MVITKISDLLSGKNVAGYYKMYQKTQWYNEQQMKEYQLEKLKKLLQHCYENVPYYFKLMTTKGINPNIDSLDILKSFPILTKEILKQNYYDFTPRNSRSLAGVKTSQTGGTTGNILYSRNDANTRSSIWATYKRFRDWMEVREREKSLILMGGHVIGKSPINAIKKKLIDWLSNSISFNPYDTSEKNLLSIENILQKNDFILVRSYSQFLFSVAKRLKDKGIKVKVKSISTTAEPLLPQHRALFKEVFNANIFDQYGCGEIGGIAYECDKHNGLHIAEERVIIETNERQELMITDLDNFAMPFIRYWNADQAIVSDEVCSCGRESKLIRQIMGRTCDYLRGLNGEFLHWAYFWHLFFDSQMAENRNLRKFQIVQLDKDHLLIRLVSAQLTKEEEDILISNIQKRLGGIKIEFNYENEIENTKSGKYRPVINNLLQ
jgi:phenylacetate-CoA ligase